MEKFIQIPRNMIVKFVEPGIATNTKIQVYLSVGYSNLHEKIIITVNKSYM
jgi:hypothetical protein